ncbi:hypothetical protein B0T20DRAFT_388530 [Sordaria brevicollis]|uniref:Uncharacterized protein n=1 Tax=Sordaria brevicollis TaxID=83679 RepID=A0AAE0UGE6_SORBR|nr:hypothetical protein B0T20DRAFT_388530 [Sordaria brevicollis]
MEGMFIVSQRKAMATPALLAGVAASCVENSETGGTSRRGYRHAELVMFPTPSATLKASLGLRPIIRRLQALLVRSNISLSYFHKLKPNNDACTPFKNRKLPKPTPEGLQITSGMLIPAISQVCPPGSDRAHRG